MGLSADIFKHNGRDFSNSGISSVVNEVTVVNVPGAAEPTVAAPAVLLVPGNLPNTAKVVPATLVGDSYVQTRRGCGPMAGGCFVSTSDSRFSSAVQALTGSRSSVAPLHDRYETQEQYDALSR